MHAHLASGMNANRAGPSRGLCIITRRREWSSLWDGVVGSLLGPALSRVFIQEWIDVGDVRQRIAGSHFPFPRTKPVGWCYPPGDGPGK